MDKDFEACLDTLQAHRSQKIELDGSIYKMIGNRENVLCGDGRGRLHLISLSKGTVTKIESLSCTGKVTHLAWVGSDKCISAHSSGFSRLWDLMECKEIAVLDIGDREENSFDTTFEVTANNRAALGSSDGYLRLWDLREVRQIAKAKAHDRSVNCICFVGKNCLTSGYLELNIKAWDSQTLEALATMQCHDYINCLMMFREDFFISGGNDGTVRLWYVASYNEVACYMRNEEIVWSVQMINKDCFIVLCSEDVLRVWDSTKQKIVFQTRVHLCHVDNDFLYVVYLSELSITSLKTYQTVTTLTLESEWKISFFHFSEGKLAFASNGCTNIDILELDEYQRMRCMRFDNYVKCVLPWGSDKLVTCTYPGVLAVWDVSERRTVAELQQDYCVSVAALTVDGRLIAVVEGCLKIWDLSAMKEIPTDVKLEGYPDRIEVTASNEVVIYCQKFVFIWNLTNFSKIGEIKMEEGFIYFLKLISDKIAVIGVYRGQLWMLKVAECKVLAKLEGHTLEVTGTAVASGNRFVSSSDDKTVKVWDVQTFTELATLQGHSAEVKAVVVAGDKCISGGLDRTLIVWNLNYYLQEAKIVCESNILQIVLIHEDLIVSRHGNNEMKVWDKCREAITLKGQIEYIAKLFRLGQFHLVSVEGENILEIWDLGQLSNCLPLCGSREILESEASAGKSIPTQHHQRIHAFKSGERVPQPHCAKLFRPYYFNALHFCAYYNHIELLTEYLGQGVPLVRGVFGSPLTLALQRDTVECVDATLDYLISIAAHENAWKSFEVINDDLVGLLKCSSLKLEAFFGVLLQRPSNSLASFISPLFPLPINLFTPHPYVPEYEVYNSTARGEYVVKFSTSLVQGNYVAGSQGSLELLEAAVNCESKRVLLSDYLKIIIETKWESCYPFTLFMAVAYMALLVCLLGTLNMQSRELCVGYLAINCLFVGYELVQMNALKANYFTEGWNVLDCVRCTLSIVWASFQLADFQLEKAFTLVVVMLDLVRGFTHFRSFRMTRIFVYLTFSVVAEMYSFLVILCYSIFAFGMFTSVLVGESSLSESWKRAYNLAMGNFDTAAYSPLEWIVFTGASVTNIVIMMNLLISILGEAYEKAQMTMAENDLHMQASLLLEYETMMTWRRRAQASIWLVTCRKADGGAEQIEWSGRVVQIVNSLTAEMARVETQITGKVEEVKQPVDEMRTKMAEIEAKMTGTDTKMGAKMEKIEAKIGEIDTKIESKIETKIGEIDTKIETKMAGIEEKVAALGERLDAVLSLLQSRS